MTVLVVCPYYLPNRHHLVAHSESQTTAEALPYENVTASIFVTIFLKLENLKSPYLLGLGMVKVYAYRPGLP